MKSDADNPENMLSRTGCVIFYANYPILWINKLMTEITFSIAEAEYVILS